jgi:hemerythrin
MSQMATREFQHEVGNSGIDADHGALARILEALEQVCDESVGADCRCNACPEKKSRCCHGLLKDLCSRMQALLLEHFQREHDLMNSLPHSQTTKAHCERHRRAHVNFSTRYNLAAAKLNDCQPAIGARELESLVLDWIRGHALEFDAELAALLSPHVGDRQRRA